MSVGTLLTLGVLVSLTHQPIQALIFVHKYIQDGKIAAEKLIELFMLQMRGVKYENRGKIIDLKTINIHQATLSFGLNAPVFENISFKIKKGMLIALTGANGSGKSSLLYVLMKVFTVSEGHIYVGQVDLVKINREDWLKKVGLVPQKVQFFTGSLVNNLCSWDDEPDLNRLNLILIELDLKWLIDKLPDGLNTMMGIEGWRFSKGQSQMLGLARLLYKDPELILLDEPDTALDTHNLKIFNTTLNNLRIKGKTILLVTHRKSLLELADKVISFKDVN